MSGIAGFVDLLKKGSMQPSNPTSFYSSSPSLFSRYPTTFASQHLFSALGGTVAYGDVAASVDEADFNPNFYSPFRVPAFEATTLKTYHAETKPILSAFKPRTFSIIVLRSLLTSYLPIVEQNINREEDDEDEEEKRVDLVAPLKKSVKDILREVTIITTRRLLERAVIHRVSDRIAWKILKDLPRSAERKAGRMMSTPCYIFCVSRTTFRGQLLGTAASWLVQVGIDIYQFLRNIWNQSKEDIEMLDGDLDDYKKIYTSEQLQLLKERVLKTTVRCTSSLVVASIGAGLGAVIIKPSIGQFIGCGLGEAAGPYVLAFLIRSLN